MPVLFNVHMITHFVSKTHIANLVLQKITKMDLFPSSAMVVAMIIVDGCIYGWVVMRNCYIDGHLDALPKCYLSLVNEKKIYRVSVHSVAELQ